MEEIIFAQGSVPVVVAAKVYGKDPSWVRAGIIAGWLPIGMATRHGKVVSGGIEQDLHGRTCRGIGGDCRQGCRGGRRGQGRQARVRRTDNYNGGLVRKRH